MGIKQTDSCPTVPSCSLRPPSSLLLPIELLDTILSLIDARRDVIAFALACRTFHQISVPRHSEYRLVRASFDDASVWSHLSERPDLAVGVRAVHILDTAAPAAGPYICKANALSSVVSALEGMQHTTSFTWRYPLKLRFEAEQLAVAAVWSTVASLPRLRELNILQPLNPPGGYPVYRAMSIEQYPLWTIGGLSSISLVNVAFLRHDASVSMFARVLERSPALESLKVVVYDWAFDLARLFGGAKLERLRKLRLEVYADEQRTGDALAALFERTPSLEDVEWQHTPLRALAPGSLPRLRRLAAHYDKGVPRLLAEQRALETLAWFELRADARTLLSCLDPYSLTRLELARFESIALLKNVAGSLPALRWLRVPSIDYMRDWRIATNEVVPRGQWAEVLSCAPLLEVFHGPPFFRDPDEDGADNSTRAREIATFAPALRRVDHWTTAPERAIAIERDGQWREIVVDESD